MNTPFLGESCHAHEHTWCSVLVHVPGTRMVLERRLAEQCDGQNWIVWKQWYEQFTRRPRPMHALRICPLRWTRCRTLSYPSAYHNSGASLFQVGSFLGTFWAHYDESLTVLCIVTGTSIRDPAKSKLGFPTVRECLFKNMDAMTIYSERLCTGSWQDKRSSLLPLFLFLVAQTRSTLTTRSTSPAQRALRTWESSTSSLRSLFRLPSLPQRDRAGFKPDSPTTRSTCPAPNTWKRCKSITSNPWIISSSRSRWSCRLQGRRLLIPTVFFSEEHWKVAHSSCFHWQRWCSRDCSFEPGRQREKETSTAGIYLVSLTPFYFLYHTPVWAALLSIVVKWNPEVWKATLARLRHVHSLRCTARLERPPQRSGDIEDKPALGDVPWATCVSSYFSCAIWWPLSEPSERFGFHEESLRWRGGVDFYKNPSWELMKCSEVAEYRVHSAKTPSWGLIQCLCSGVADCRVTPALPHWTLMKWRAFPHSSSTHHIRQFVIWATAFLLALTHFQFQRVLTVHCLV